VRKRVADDSLSTTSYADALREQSGGFRELVAWSTRPQ